MSAKVLIGEDLQLPPSAFEDVIAILGRRGRGKTTTATVIVEELARLGERFVVVDPVGVWYGLRSSRDGRAPGLPVVILGGEHADVALDASGAGGEVIAEFVVDPTSPSCVLDLSSFTQGEMVRFMTAFLGTLYHKARGHRLHVILDEADQFAPQRAMPNEAQMLGAAQRVTKLGRAKGLHPVLITQRPATLSKNVLTQAGMLIAHALTGPQDRTAVDEWVKMNATPEQREQFLRTLGGLQRGLAYFWSPDQDLFKVVQVRDRHTFDSSATPKSGGRVAPKKVAEVDLKALEARMAATIEAHKANDPTELKAKVRELQAELRKANTFQSNMRPALPEKVREVSVLKPGDITRLEAAVEKAIRLYERGREAQVAIKDAILGLVTTMAATKENQARLQGAGAIVAVSPPGYPEAAGLDAPSWEKRIREVQHNVMNAATEVAERVGTQVRILEAVFELVSRGLEATRDRTARWIGIHPRGGRYLSDWSALHKEGLLHYAGGEGARLTPKAAPVIGRSSIELGAEGLLKNLRAQGGTLHKTMRTIMDSGPFESREHLAAALGIHHRGGRFLSDLSHLQHMGLVTKGRIAATPAVYE